MEWHDLLNGSLLSYIRVGGRDGAPHYSSSPVLSSTGDYIWDFLNWGFTANFTGADYSAVQNSMTDIVPYGNMDQGKLFVRVSIRDLAALQLGYQKGIATLSKAQSDIAKLSMEKQQLEALVKDWAVKTKILTKESKDLRQEIQGIRSSNSNTVSIESMEPMLEVICSKICQCFGSITPEQALSLTFDDTLKFVSSLTPVLQERLMLMCPRFQEFMNTKDTHDMSLLQMNDMKTKVSSILHLASPYMEHALLSSLIFEFNQKYGCSSSSELSPDTSADHGMKKGFKTEHGIAQQISTSNKRLNCSFHHQSKKSFYNELSNSGSAGLAQSKSASSEQVRLSSKSLQSLNSISVHKISMRANRASTASLRGSTSTYLSALLSKGFDTPLAHSTPHDTLCKKLSTKGQTINMAEVLSAIKSRDQQSSNKRSRKKSKFKLKLPAFLRRKRKVVEVSANHSSGGSQAASTPTKKYDKKAENKKSKFWFFRRKHGKD